MGRLGLAVICAAALVFAAWATRAAETPPTSIETDYSQELLRVAPLESTEALKSFTIAPGFELQRVAAEPNVASPVAIAFDEFGRMFVVEMRGYSENRDEKVSRIRRLEDRDQDGTFETATTYAEGLAWPTAVACWKGGLIVGDAPDILYFEDRDDDGVSDSRRVLFTGLNWDNVQGLINSFQWGLDNRIYAAVSGCGGDLKTPSDDKIPSLQLHGRDLAIDPRTMTAVAVSGGGQHGLSFNDWGERFVCNNSDHLQEVMYEDRYVARNPYLIAPSPRRSIAADGPQCDVFRTSPVEPWRVIRSRLRAAGVVPGHVERGGAAAGYFTGATGVTIYRGDAWPETDEDIAIVGDVGGNLIHRKRLEPSGVGYIGRRIDERSELVASSDPWFRPVQFAGAPDGSLFVLDMYREVIEHPHAIPPQIKKHLDLTSGRDRGRIYRLVPTGFQSKPIAMPGTMTTPELVALLEHRNGWHRDTAARLLYERQDRAAIEPLVKLTKDSTSPVARIHALWALEGLDALADDVLLARLADEHPCVRVHAVRLAESRSVMSNPFAERTWNLSNDPDIRVRYQTAFSLGELPPSPPRNSALAAIASHDIDDEYVRAAVVSSLKDGAGEMLRLLADDASFQARPGGRELMGQLAAQIGKAAQTGKQLDDDDPDLGMLMKSLRILADRDSPALATVVQKLGARLDTEFGNAVAIVTQGKSDTLVRELVAKAIATVFDESAATNDRVAAVEQLRLLPFDVMAAVPKNLLIPTAPIEVQSALLAAMASYEDAKAAEIMLAGFSTFSPRLKSEALDSLLSRAAWTKLVLDAVESGAIASGELDPLRLQALSRHRDEDIRRRAIALQNKSQLGARAEVVAAYRGALDMPGDAERGRQTFARVCAACHRVEKVGHELGPNLRAMKARGAEAILLNVLDPNREVNPQYVNYLVTTVDGRSLTGMIASETATSVTLRRGENASDNVLRIDIDEMQSSGQSLMPEGLEKQLDPQAMADLLEYLTKLDD